MAGRGRTTSQKRQKEQLRLERRAEKAARKLARKASKQAGSAGTELGEPELEELDSTPSPDGQQ